MFSPVESQEDYNACVEEGRPVFDRAIPKPNFTLQNPFFMKFLHIFEYLQSHLGKDDSTSIY
jgi:hypothetical protein